MRAIQRGVSVKSLGNRLGRRSFDTVGVAGSIPVEPTIFNSKSESQVIVIPDNYDVIPAVEYIRGRPHFFRCLVKKKDQKRERGVKPARQAKKAR